METIIKNSIISLINDKYSILLDDLILKNPPKKEFGDYSFNAGILSKELKKSPLVIADEIIGDIEKMSFVKKVSNENGFINLFIDNSIFTDIFSDFYNDYFSDKKYFNVGNNEKIVVDYIGANVGKTLHIGHMCTPNIGQAMINVYKKLGYEVISDSHIGDWGIIFGKLITAYKLWGDENKLKENAVDYLLELYVKITSEIKNDPSLELENRTREEFKLLSQGDTDSIKIWKEFTSYSIDAMNKILERLNVKPDYNIGESFYEGLGLPKIEDNPDLEFDMKTIVSELLSKSIAIKNEDNSVGVVFENDKLSSCILQKRDGTHGYLASDLASIKYRTTNWNPEKIVYFVDVRQKLHFEQAFEISKNAGWLGKTKLFHAYNGFISGKDGAFSSREGNIIKLGDLLDEADIRAEKIILEKRDDLSEDEIKNLSKIIGIGAIKYGYLKKSRETDVIFDWDEFMTFDGNSGPYIQYAYVRAKKILSKSGFKDFDFDNITTFSFPEELNLIKNLLSYKDILINTSEKNMPHILCKYSYDLTKAFSSFYNSVHILNEENEDIKKSRLKLIYIFSEILKDSFSLLGINMPEKM